MKYRLKLMYAKKKKKGHKMLAAVCTLGKDLNYQESGWKYRYIYICRSACSLCESKQQNILRYNIGWYLLGFTFPETLHIIKMKPDIKTECPPIKPESVPLSLFPLL